MTENELTAAHRQAIDDGMVKVGIPMELPCGGIEWCFAKRVSATHARIDNIPVFCSHVNYADIVEFAEQDSPHVLFKAFVRVKTQGSECLTFSCVPESLSRTLSVHQLRARATAVRERLDAAPEHVRPLCIEGVEPGVLSAAWPVGTDVDAVAAFLDAVIEG